MKRVILSCPSVQEKIDTTYGLRSLRNYALSRPGLRGNLQIDILPVSAHEPAASAADRILERAPDLVGISTFIWNVADNLSLAEEIKGRSPEVRIVLGGPQVSDPLWDILEHTAAVDVVVRGEGEETFAELLGCWLDTGDPRSPRIAGISYHGETGETVHNPGRPPLRDLDEIPPIYDSFTPQPGVLYSVETVRGCYHRCAYCVLGSEPFRRHSLEYAFAEIDRIAATGLRMLNSLDASFTFNPRRTTALARHLERRGFRYTCCGKAEELSFGMIDLLLETGVLKIEIGLQSTHPETLKQVGRRTDLKRFRESTRELLDKARGTDVEVTIDTICGLPGDSLETFRDTLDFAYSLRPHRAAAFPLQLLPATELFRRADELGIQRRSMRMSGGGYGRYNLHRPGLVTATPTFPAADLEEGRRICLLNGVIMDSYTTGLVHRILDLEGLRFTTWYDRFNRLLPAGFHELLEDTARDPSLRAGVWRQFRGAFAEYGRAASRPEVLEAIGEVFPEARAS